MEYQYATRFLLDDPVMPGIELFADARMTTLEWLREGLARGARGRFTVPHVLTEGEMQFGDMAVVAIRSCSDGEEAHFLATVEHEHFSRAVTPVLWRTDVRLTAIGDEVEFDVHVRVKSVDPEASFPYRPERPRIVLTLINCHRAAIRGRQLFSHAQEVAAGDVPAFVGEVILNPARRLPAVILRAPAEPTRPTVDPETLADRLAGNGEVYVLASEDAANATAERLGFRFTPGPGEVVEFLPDFDPRARDARDRFHRVSTDSIERAGPNASMNRIVRVLTDWTSRDLENYVPYWASSVTDMGCDCEILLDMA